MGEPMSEPRAVSRLEKLLKVEMCENSVSNKEEEKLGIPHEQKIHEKLLVWQES